MDDGWMDGWWEVKADVLLSCCPAMSWCAMHVFEDTIGKGKKRMNASFLCYI